MTDIRQWLEQHGLGKYAEVFEENEIGVAHLHLLTDEDVRELGLPMGPRKQFLAAVAEESPKEDSERLPRPTRHYLRASQNAAN